MVNVGKAGRMLPKGEMAMSRKGAHVERSRSRNWRRRREKRRKKKKMTMRVTTSKRKRRRLRELWLRKK